MREPKCENSKGSSLMPIPDDHQDKFAISQTQCLNCGGELTGEFCPHCGQKRIRDRLKFGEILREFPAKIFNFERGFWLTFIDLWRRPGILCSDYVQGKRKRYLNPLSYFFIGATAQLINLWLNSSFIRKSIEENIVHARETPAQAEQFQKIDEALQGNTVDVFADVYITSLAQSYTYLAFLTFCLPMGMLLWIFHRWLKSNYHFAEVMVFSIYVAGHCLLVTAVTTPIFIRISMLLQVISAQGFYLGFALWAHGGFFRSGILSRFGTAAAVIGAMTIFFISIIVMFILCLIGYLFFNLR